MIEAVVQQARIRKVEAARLIDFIAKSIIADLLLEGKSNYPGLGSFTVVTRAAAERRNPQTGVSIGIKPAHKVIKFKAFAEVRRQFV
jgi:DNA-binding protein HU-beta